MNYSSCRNVQVQMTVQGLLRTLGFIYSFGVKT